VPSSNVSLTTNNKKDGCRQRNVRQFSAISLRHIIWLPHESHAGMSLTSVLRLQAFGYVKRVRHILASHGYAPGTIAVNVTWMERGFNACKIHRSMYPSIFTRFPVIQPVSSKVRHFSTFFCTFWPTLATPLGQSR